jgi:tol-pal system protein YbgF
MDLTARRARAICLGALFFSGCAARPDDVEKQLSEMHAEIIGLRAANSALNERMDQLEIKTGSLKGYQAPSSGEGEPKPDLAVVRLVPPDQHETATTTTTDEAATIALRSTGKGGVVQEEAKGNEAAGGAAGEFAKAKELFDKKNYTEALSAFSGFLVRYPDNAKATDAMFFRGECYLAKNEWAKAAGELDAVARISPPSDRAPDALLDLVKAYEKLGDKESAEKAKKRLKTDFPKSNAAKKLVP